MLQHWLLSTQLSPAAAHVWHQLGSAVSLQALDGAHWPWSQAAASHDWLPMEQEQQVGAQSV